MPRKKNTEETVFPKIGIKKGLKEEVDGLLVDPETGKLPFGAWMGLVDRLLREWVRKQRRGGSRDEVT